MTQWRPARRLKRKKTYRGYCFELVRDTVIWPNRRKLERDLILHGGISVILPEIDPGHLILIRQYRYGADQNLWELPAGTIHPKETPLRCAQREILEETGFQARRWKPLGTFWTSPGYNTEKVFAYRASGLRPSRQALEDDEILTPHVFPVSTVRRMLLGGRIRDSKSIIPLFYYFHQKGL